MTTIFGALTEKYESSPELSPVLATSGFVLEKSRCPYVSLTKRSTNTDELYSCFTRIEKHAYQFSIYTESYQELKDIRYKLEYVFDYCKLDTAGFTNLQWNGGFTKEIIPQLYYGIVGIDVYIERDLSLSKFNELTEVDSDDIQQGVWLRSQQFKDLLPYEITTSSYNLENSQTTRIVIPNFDYSTFNFNSCERQEKYDFEFKIYTQGLEDLEEAVEQIHKVYDNCHINFRNVRQMKFEWQIDVITEEMPQLWCASVNYELWIGRDIKWQLTER